jgi:hypothetical protein
MIVFDTTALSAIWVPGATAYNRTTKKPIKHAKERVDALIERMAAAIELGLRTAKAIAAGDKREGIQADWTKIKFDRQIVSIAIVANASQIISEDGDIAAIGERWNIPVTSIEELPVPDELIPPPLLANLEDESGETNG